MSLRKGLALFFLFSFGVSSAILIFSVDGNTWTTILHARKGPLGLAFLFVLCAWTCDALRFCSLARAMGQMISFLNGVILTWLHYFGCAVTPMQVGGGPFQVFVLYQSGIPIGQGIAITLVRTLLTTFLLSVVAPVAFLMHPDIFKGHHIMAGVFVYVLLFSIVIWVAFVASVLRPHWVKRVGSVIVLWLRRFKILGRNRILCTIRRINAEIDGYAVNMRLLFSHGIWWLLLAFVLSLGHLLFLFSVLPCLIWSVGLPVHYVESLLVQAVLLFALYFVPTPGASGVAEGGGAALFGLLMPWSMAGVMAVAWRFFTEYLAILMGAIVAVRFIGWGTAEMIVQSRQREYREIDNMEMGHDD